MSGIVSVNQIYPNKNISAAACEIILVFKLKSWILVTIFVFASAPCLSFSCRTLVNFSTHCPNVHQHEANQSVLCPATCLSTIVCPQTTRAPYTFVVVFSLAPPANLEQSHNYFFLEKHPTTKRQSRECSISRQFT